MKPLGEACCYASEHEQDLHHERFICVPHYVNKVEKKGRTKEELDEVICWLTGWRPGRTWIITLEAGTTFETFFADADLNPNSSLITGVVCGVRRGR